MMNSGILTPLTKSIAPYLKFIICYVIQIKPIIEYLFFIYEKRDLNIPYTVLISHSYCARYIFYRKIERKIIYYNL